MRRHQRLERSVQRGFSLIELMVSLVIGLVVTLAITGVMIRSEGAKRTNTSVNDVNQTGAYAAYVMDRALRSAGSGFTSLSATAFGCRLNAAKKNTAILPRPAALQAPFANMGQSFYLAPVIIGRGLSSAGSDTLTVMAGTAGYGESPMRVLPSAVTATTIGLPNVLTFKQNDLVMLVESGVGSTVPACLVQQVAPGFTETPVPNPSAANQTLTLGGPFASTTGTDANLTQYGLSGRAFLIAMGNAATTSQFQVFGVGDNATLFSVDLLRLTQDDDTPTPIADGVVEMRALYGIDTTNDRKIDSWVVPAAGSGYEYSVLNTGTAAAIAALQRIVSIKVGFILRTSLYEREVVSPTSVTLFSDLGTALQQTRALTTDETHYRFRTVEVTVPLRNVLLQP